MKYIKQGSRIAAASDENMVVFNTIPTGCYKVVVDDRGNYYLESTADLVPPAKIYGGMPKYADRILNTFQQRTKSTGALLLGPKGTGKTMLVKLMSQRLRQQNIPTILVPPNMIFPDTMDFLSKLDTTCMVVFDELDKASDNRDKDKDTATNCMLDLLDGSSVYKHLFILVANREHLLSEFLKSRPGRVYYKLVFHDIPDDVLKEYLEDTLDNEQYRKDITTLLPLVSPKSFDVINAIVEECLRYDMSPVEAMSMLNVDLGIDGNFDIDVMNSEGHIIAHSTREPIRLTNAAGYCATCTVYPDFVNEEVQGKYRDDDEDSYMSLVLDIDGIEVAGHTFVWHRTDTRADGSVEEITVTATPNNKPTLCPETRYKFLLGLDKKLREL